MVVAVKWVLVLHTVMTTISSDFPCFIICVVVVELLRVFLGLERDIAVFIVEQLLL